MHPRARVERVPAGHLTEAQSFALAIFAVSVVAGAFGAIVGVGGGAVIIPVLVLGMGVNIRYAIGASIVSVIATSSGAAAAYVRDHITNIRVAMLLEIATTLGAFGGVALAPYVTARALYAIFALVLAYSAVAMVRGQREGAVRARVENDAVSRYLGLASSYPDAGREVSYAVTGVPLGLVLMLGAGLVSGLLGIGSGALKVPAMDRAMKLPIKVSSATSNFMIGVTAAASAGAYYMRGDIAPLLAAPVALGILVGSLAGTRLMVRLPSGQIRHLFVGLLILIALEMGLKSLGLGGPG